MKLNSLKTKHKIVSIQMKKQFCEFNLFIFYLKISYIICLKKVNNILNLIKYLLRKALYGDIDNIMNKKKNKLKYSLKTIICKLMIFLIKKIFSKIFKRYQMT